MKRKILTIALLVSFMIGSMAPFAMARSVRVNGYYRSNGTYVSPYYRTSPDRSFSNNWSTKGNVNPYTGTPGYKTYTPSYKTYNYRRY